MVIIKRNMMCYMTTDYSSVTDATSRDDRPDIYFLWVFWFDFSANIYDHYQVLS